MVDHNLALSGELENLLYNADHVVQLEKDDYLFSAGELVNELYIVKSGKIQIKKTTSDGREMALRICNKGDIVGEISLYREDVKYILNAVALVDSEVSVITKENLERELLHNRRLGIELLNLTSDMALRDQTKIRDLVMYGRRGALFSTLIRFSNTYGKDTDDGVLINIKLTNQELANFCGTSRESINRLLSGLKADKIISVDKGYITIHDMVYLKREINCENCPVVICGIH